MNLAEIRNELESAIFMGGISKTYKFVPERPQPPCALIEPATDFINVYENQYSADYAANWQIKVIVPFATNQKETETLDDTLDTLIPAIWDNTTASRLQVDKPFILSINNAEYLSTNINITIDIEGGN